MRTRVWRPRPSASPLPHPPPVNNSPALPLTGSADLRLPVFPAPHGRFFAATPGEDPLLPSKVGRGRLESVRRGGGAAEYGAAQSGPAPFH